MPKKILIYLLEKSITKCFKWVYSKVRLSATCPYIPTISHLSMKIIMVPGGGKLGIPANLPPVSLGHGKIHSCHAPKLFANGCQPDVCDYVLSLLHDPDWYSRPRKRLPFPRNTCLDLLQKHQLVYKHHHDLKESMNSKHNKLCLQ